MESLRIYLNVHNEVLVRCHRCGLSGTALDLYRAYSKLTWAEIAEALKENRVFDGDEIPSAWLERAQRWEKFAALFEKGKAFFRQWVRSGQIQELGFGEVGLCSAIQLKQTLPGVKLMSRWGKTALFLVELRRSLHGIPTHALIRHRKKGHAVAVFDFHPPEPLHLMLPEWALYRDWSDELIVFTDLGLAGELHEMVSKAPSGTPPPLAWIAECFGPLVDEVPYQTVRYIPGPQEGPELALAFAQPGVEVLVRSEEAVERVATDIIDRTRNTDPIAYLHAVLQKPWIAPAAAQRLTEAVTAGLGGSAAARIARSGATDRVLPCTIRGVTYLCRNGIYVKKRGKGDWEPVANFSLRIEESSTNANAEVAHQVLLLVVEGTARFTVPDRQLHDGHLLLERATAAAIEQGLPDLPRVMDPVDLKRLPAIVQATQLKPALRTESPSVLGFDKGRFHGPNFTVTSTGATFRNLVDGTKDCPAPWMRPEQPQEPAGDHLALKANQFATWLQELAEDQQQIASVVTYAALAWLQRGSRGLPSHLLLPSEAHLDLLGALTDLVPIEVGRGPREHLGLPRLMRSSYWRPDQFERHGRIVAALEDQHRKIDTRLPLVVHQWTGDTLPSPPAGILALLTHCVLGTRDTRTAVSRFVSLVECADVRHRLQSHLQKAACYWANSGRYLDAFLEAVRTLPDLEHFVIRRGKKVFLDREVVGRLNEEYGFGFRGTRLIDELREGFPLPQPARYGREQVPVFRLPPAEVVTG